MSVCLSDLCNDEEVIAWFTLSHNLLTILKLDRLQGISYRQPLPLVQVICKTPNRDTEKWYVLNFKFSKVL